jgi:voltage-gated sodium channel
LAVKFYGSTYTQILFAGLIFANFVVSMVEAQILPSTAQEIEIFHAFELFFTVIFATELLINMYANYFLKFWRSAWNWFDFLVVFISLLSLGVGNLPGITVLRLFRAFRVFRLFKRIPSLRKIVVGVAHALPGVASAFMLLGLVMGIWSILGVGFFKDEFPDHYGDFFKAMLTSFQIMTFDGWASEVTRPILLKYGGVYGFYFMSYVFIASIFMANVIIAILLDKYLSATSDVKMRLDDTRESLVKLEKDLLGRFSHLEEYLMSNNLKYAFHSMSPMERKLALQSVQLELNSGPPGT